MPIKAEFPEVGQKRSRYEDCFTILDDPDILEMSEIPRKRKGSNPNLVPISSSVETSRALFITILKHPLVECNVLSVSERCVEMLCVPEIPVLQWFKDVALKEEIDEVVMTMGPSEKFQDETLKFEISMGSLDQNKQSWKINREKNNRTILRIPKVESVINIKL